MEEFTILIDEECKYIAEEKTSNKITLRYSKSDIWSSRFKGAKIGHLKDTGNKIKIKLNNKKINLEYDEFIELLSIMKVKEIIDYNL